MGGDSNGGDRNDPGDGKTCFIKGFDASMDEDSLKQALTDAFGEYGEVERVGLPFDRDNQCLKGFGFVVFAEANGATVRYLCRKCSVWLSKHIRAVINGRGHECPYFCGALRPL